MKLFGTSHIIILLITIIAPFFFYLLKKKYHSTVIPETVLSILIISAEFAYIITKLYSGTFDIRYHLPLQLCDLAAIMIVLSFITQRKVFFEAAFFWGMGGTLQALITPDLKVDFPHVDFFVFFFMHSGIVIGVLYYSFSGTGRLLKYSFLRVFFITQIYIIIMLPVNYAINANYGYLMEKPFNGSLMDYLGPWPWYLLSFELVGFILFFLLQYFYSFTESFHLKK